MHLKGNLYQLSDVPYLMMQFLNTEDIRKSLGPLKRIPDLVSADLVHQIASLVALFYSAHQRSHFATRPHRDRCLFDDRHELLHSNVLGRPLDLIGLHRNGVSPEIRQTRRRTPWLAASRIVRWRRHGRWRLLHGNRKYRRRVVNRIR